MKRNQPSWSGLRLVRGPAGSFWRGARQLLPLLALLAGPAHGQVLPVTNGLRLQLKADAGVTAAGGSVSAWADQSSNGFHLAQPAAGLRPTLTANAVNGKPTLSLDGSDDFLESVTSVDLLGSQTSFTFYAVTKPGTTQKTYADIFDYSHSGSVRFVIQQDGTNTNTFYNNGVTAANQTLPTNGFSIYGGTHVNGGTVQSRLNGGNVLTGTAGTNSFGTPSSFRVGNWVSGGREFNGQIAEVLVYNRVLTTIELNQVELYLSTKYDISTTLNAAAAPAANLDRVEYFVDSDPGVGLATSVALGTSATDISSLAFAVPLGSFSRGLHRLGVRSRDLDQNWSTTAIRPFFYENATLAGNIDEVEYFLDADPGLGNAANASITPAGTLTNVAFTVDMSSVGQGFHRLWARSHDAGTDTWSLTGLRQFYYQPPTALAAANIDRVEYFLDNDPGVGSATAATITPGTDLPSVAFTVDMSSVNQGLHQLFVRSHDAGSGRWSLTALKQFYYQPPTVLAAGNIDRVEYFLDNDPGVGSATAASITPGTNLPTVAFTVDMSAVPQGFHRLWVRSHDAGSGRWSLSGLQQFYYQPPTVLAAGNIDRVEYFLDNDPGVGSATAASITPGANLSSVSFAVNLSSVSRGVHKLYVRSHDAGSDRWSLTGYRYFFSEIIPALANMTKVEYFYDADPGIGLGTDAPVTTPAVDLNGFPFVGDITALSAGTHRLYVRSQDANGKWSQTRFTDFVRPSGTPPSITSFTPTIGAGGTVVTITGTNFLGATDVTFNGVSGTSLTVNSATSITVTAPVGGSTGLVCVVAPAGTGCSNAAQRFTYLPVVTGISPATLCAGAAVNVTFTATGYAAGNLFTAQLSNSVGSFTAPIALGTLSGASGGTINGTVPAGTAAGSAYRIRIVADNPAATGAANPTNLSLQNLSGVAATANSPVQTGGTIQLNVTSAPVGSTFAWTGPGTFSDPSIQNPTISNATTANSGTYQVVVTSLAGCSVTRTVSVTVNAPVIITLGTVSPTSYCTDSNITVPFTVAGGPPTSGNVFTLELSNASGSFASGVTTLGTISGTTSSSFTRLIPAGTANGTQYRVRVRGSLPAVSSADNGTDLSITNMTATVISSNSPLNVGQTLQLNVTGAPAGTTFAWTGPGTLSDPSIQNPTLSNAQLANSGNYQVVMSYNGCQMTRVVAVTVNCLGNNVSDGLPASAYSATSVYQSNTAQNGFNGGLWASGGFAPKTLQVLFPTPQSVSRVLATANQAPNGVTDHRLELTFDGGATWSEFAQINRTTINGEQLTFTLTRPYTGVDGVRLRTVSSPSWVSWANVQVIEDVCAPFITSFTPTSGPSGTTVIITGGRFTGATAVVFNNASASSFTVDNDGQITAVAPSNGTSGPLAVLTASGMAISPNPYTYQLTLTTGTISPGSYCAGSAISIPYTMSGGVPTSGNDFTAQLSNASGSFASPVTIGTLNTTSSGTISGTIPAGTAPGTGYRIRVLGSTPATTGSDNGANLTITAPFTATATAASQAVSVGDPISLGVSSAPTGATYAWTGPNSFSSASATPGIASATLAASGTYNLTVSNGACTSTSNIFVRVTDCSTAPSNVGANLPAANYSQVGVYQTSTSQNAWNGGGWNAGGFSGNMTVDLGAPVTLTRLDLTPSPSPNSSVSITVQVSANMTSWTPVTTINGTFPSGAPASNRRSLNFGASPITNVRGIRLVASYGSSWVSISDVRAFVCPMPYISSFTPAAGPAGTTVVLTGGNFTGATGVAFNGVTAPGFSVDNAGQITVTAPPTGSTGLISVTTVAGTAISATNYSYQLGIAAGPISPATFCTTTGNAAVSVPFTVTHGALNAGNVFTAQLSNASGSFASPTNIGTVSGTGSGTISGSIPAATVTGTGYRIRVVASAPATTGSDNGTDLTITKLTTVAATSNSPLVAGGTIQLDVTNAPVGATFAWTGPGTVSNTSAQNPTISNAQSSNSGTYQVVVTSNGCQVTRTVNVTVNNAPGLTMGTFNGSLCGGQSFSIGFAATGSAFNAGNSVTAQLSDASGSFASAVSIGSVANVIGPGSSSVSVTIPANTPTGTGYRVRLVASSPSATSNDNGSNLSITTLPTAAIASNNSPVAYNGTVTLTAQAVSGATYTWSVPGVGAVSTGTSPTLNVPNATPANSGTYTLYVSYAGNCPNSTTASVTVNPSTLPILTMAQFNGTLCAGTGTINFSFNVTGNSFGSGNTITAELSDASGSFAAPVSVGSVGFTGQGNGSITASIPGNTPQGNGYRIRLTGSNPSVTSQSDNGSNLTINAQPIAVINANNSPVANGGTVTLTAQAVSGATYQWVVPGFGTVSTGTSPTLNFNNATPANSGTYSLYVTSGNNCPNSTTTSVTVNAPASATLATNSFGGSFCPGSVFNVPFTVGGSFNSGNVFTAQLSNASGSFASATNIGSVSGTGSGTMSVTIPLGTANGSAYRIRVVASSPAMTGSDNGQNLSIGALTFTWTGGAGSTDWFNPANWSCGQVPTSTSVVIIPTGLSFYPVVGGSTASVFHLTVQTGASLTINSTFHLYGNVTVDGTGSVGGSSASSWYFYGSGTQFMNGTGSLPLQVGSVYINPGVTLNQQYAMNVYGSWYNNGIYAGNPLYGVNFNGTGASQCVCGSNSTSFYGFTVAPTALVTLGINTNFLGNLSVGGNFNSGSWAVVFDGTVPQTLGGGGNSIFNNITITNTTGVTLTDDITVLGNWRNDGLFSGGSYSVIFAGTAAQTIGGNQVTNFYNVRFQNNISVTLNQNIYVLGNFNNTGVFYGYSGPASSITGYWVRFGGSTAQVITAGLQTYFYHFYVDNSAGVSLGTNIHIAGNYYLYSGFFNPGTYVCDFNGFGGYEQTVGGYQPLTFYGWNIVSGTTVRLNQNCSWLGGIVNAGDFYGYTFVGGIYTGYTCTFGGSVAQALSGLGNYYFWHVSVTNTLASVTFNTNVHVLGDWLNYGVWNGGTHTVFFDGPLAQLIGGSQITNFYHVTINNLISVTLNQNIYVLGNWGGNGKFFGTGFYTFFNGSVAQTISCSNAATRFGTVHFSNPTSVTLLSDIYLNGNWTHDGGFVANGQTVYFAGSATQFIAGTTPTIFHHVNIVNNATVQINRNITLLGNWLNYGSFLHNNLLVSFTGTGAQIVGGSSVTHFYDVTFNNLVRVTLNQNIYVLGNFINSGVFYGYDGPLGYFVRFAGSVLQVVNANATTYFYHFYADNLAGVQLMRDVYIAGNFYLYSGSFLHNGFTCYFNGPATAPQTIGGYAPLTFFGWNIATGSDVTLNQHTTLLGSFANAGTFHCSSPFRMTFAGSIAQTLSGLGSFNFWHVTWNNGVGITLNRDITVRGDWYNAGGFLANGYRVFFGGTLTQFIDGSVNTIFHHLTINSGATVQINRTITLLGDWLNHGSFLHNNLLVYFNGTVLQTIGGTAVTRFYDLTLNNAINVSLGFNIDVVHNFVNQGGFCGCGFLTRFNGIVPQTIACANGRTHFHHLTFDNAQGVTLLNNVAVSGNWVNNGGYLHGGQTIFFDGTAGQTIGGTVSTPFYGWTNTNNTAAGVSLLQNVSVSGNWLNDGRYCGCGFATVFNGSAAQGLTCTTGNSNFHHLTLANTSASGVTLTGNINVSGNWLVSGPWFPQTYTVFFNGTGGQSVGLGGSITRANFHHLTIANTSVAGVSLNANTPLYLTGNFANNGVFSCGTNGVFASGTTAQAFGGSSPTTFYDWTIQNPAGASCTGTGGTATAPALGIQHVLTLAAGSGNLGCGGHLTLLSNASGTAMVVNEPGGGECTGIASMERFITGLGSVGYRHYASPMKLNSTTTVQEFADDLPVFNLNPAYNTVGNSVTPFPTLFKYEQGRITTGANNNLDRGYMVPGASESLEPLHGYSAMTDPTTTVDIQGVLQNGPVTTPVSRGSASEAGWQLMGNPYPAPMDWDVVRTTPGMLANVAEALYVFQPSGRYTGSYKTYVNGIGQNGGSKDLAAMQGYYVRATGTGSVNLTNAVRATAYRNPAFNRQDTGTASATNDQQHTGTSTNQPIIRLSVAPETQPLRDDEAVLYFAPGAGLGFSPKHDAYKLQLNADGRPTLWSNAGNEMFAINGLPELATAPVVPLGVRVTATGRYVLNLTAAQNLPAGTQVWLEDRVLNRRQNLAQASTYAFTMAATYTGQRFFLNFVAARPTAVTVGSLEARTALYPNPTTGKATLELSGLGEQGAVKVDVVNVLGQQVRQLSVRPRQGFIAETLDLSSLPAGVYTVRVHAQEGTVIKRLVRE